MLSIKYFPYIGPSWRSDKTVVEISFSFDKDGNDGFPHQVSNVRSILVSNGILAASEVFPQLSLPQDRQLWCASLLAQTALLFQRKTGHHAEFFDVLKLSDSGRIIAVLEYEHGDVGLTSVKLAYEFLSGQRKLLGDAFRMFGQFARERLLPLDTGVIIKVARQRDIPCFHLERLPFKRRNFDELTGGDCVRPNGLVMLGQGAHQHVLDGVFCLDKSKGFKGLYKSRAKRLAMLNSLSIPVVEPVGSQGVDVTTYDVVVINANVIAVIDRSDGSTSPVKECNASLINHVLSLHQALEKAPLVVTVQSGSSPGSTVSVGPGVLDFDLAPRLDEVLARSADMNDLLESAARAIVEWLFPAGSPSRIPSIAITGTNGKTTTTRMINRILGDAGRKTGMVCTDGIFLDGELYREGDLGTAIGHLDVLTQPTVDTAVLETHHKGILRRGFAFDNCDIAVCLNVTDDHLGDESIETVEQMARVKQALPQRAREAAILNADDEHCLAMRTSLKAKRVCLVSMASGVDELRALVQDGAGSFCVLEERDADEWMVVYHDGSRVPIMPVASIPATFDATARFNVSNAMHAVAATYLLGVEAGTIKRTMLGFGTELASTPGRLNVFDELPFRVIMDFAHNPDGMRRICEFVDAQTVPGRKILAFSGIIDRADETIKNVGRAVAGHFDFYFCKDYVRVEDKAPRSVTHILQAALIESGVSLEKTAVKTSGKQVIFEIFDSCQPGDLLVMLMGHIEKHKFPGYIREYAGQLRGNGPGV